MSTAAKVVIIFCLCISLGLMGVGTYLIFTPDNTTVEQTDNTVQQTVANQVIQSTDTNQVIDNNQTVITDTQQNTVTTNTNTQTQTNTNTNTSTSNGTVTDVSKMTQQQLLDKLTGAVNSTKASTKNVSVHHVESITVNITECPGESVVKPIITPIINKFTAPEEETIQFTNGKGTNGDGEAVTLACFPPVNKQFTLTLAGVQSITGKTEGANSVITVKLKPESVTYASPVPQYNAASIGYLDVASLGLPSAISISSGTFNYTGSTITATINSNGLLSDIKYSLPMVVSIDGKVSIISGTIGFTGEQNEQWTFNWQ